MHGTQQVKRKRHKAQKAHIGKYRHNDNSFKNFIHETITFMKKT